MCSKYVDYLSLGKSPWLRGGVRDVRQVRLLYGRSDDIRRVCIRSAHHTTVFWANGSLHREGTLVSPLLLMSCIRRPLSDTLMNGHHLADPDHAGLHLQNERDIPWVDANP